jgi:hypothetical protein
MTPTEGQLLRAAKVHMVRRCKPNAIELADRRLALHWYATVDDLDQSRNRRDGQKPDMIAVQ